MSYLSALQNLRRQVETDVVEPVEAPAAPRPRGLATRTNMPQVRQPEYEPLSFATNAMRTISRARQAFQEKLRAMTEAQEEATRPRQQTASQQAMPEIPTRRSEAGADAPNTPLSPVMGDMAPTTSRPQSRASTATGDFSDRRSTATTVFNSFREAGFSPAQARALTAEINRENSMRPDLLFGSHSDPHNRATNVGMLSWQGARATRLMEFLRERGQLDEEGRIRRTPEALVAQAQYLRWEMENDPAYRRTLTQFLNNPDVDFDTAHTILGDNFIRWRRTDPRYRDSGYQRINEGYALINAGRRS